MAFNNKLSGSVRIAAMTLDDVAEVMRIEGESFSNPGSENLWARELESEMARNLVAKICLGETEAVVGYINCWEVAGEVQLNNIAVKIDFRRSGIALKLLSAMLFMAEDEGISAVTLEVRSSNISAIKLYEKFGFVIKGTRKGYYDHEGEDALIMWADIRKK